MATTLTWTVGGRDVLVTFDACTSQGFEGTAEPTEHNVERGAPVSDHVRPGARTITLEGAISNRPLTDDGTNGSRQVARDGALVWDTPFDRVRTVDALLQAAVDAGALVTVSTSLRPSVTECVITRHRADRSAAIGDAVQVSLELRRLRMVDVRRVQVPEPAQRRGQRQGQRGAQPGGQTADRRSALARALDGARSLL